MITKHNSPPSVLTNTDCMQIIKQFEDSSLNVQRNNIYMGCVIDGAMVDDRLVVYELQPVTGSQISTETLFQWSGLFEQIFYFHNGKMTKISNTTEYGPV